MNKKTLWLTVGILFIIGAIAFAFYYTGKPSDNNNIPVTQTSNTATSSNSIIVYKNTDYGFTFSLPASWQGYSIVTSTWQGNALKNTVAPTGPKLIIRNPKWTASAHYEDIPILIFTISEWNEYLAEDFAVSAAPIQARELARNDTYVFALPPRWDFDYSLGYKEAEDIIAGNPLHTFNNPVQIKDETTASLNQKILNKGISITPLEVVSDSRCPVDVQCIWAGEVSLKVKLQKDTIIKEATLKIGTPFRFEGNTISLTKVSPEKNTKKPFNKEEYSFTFVVIPL